MICVFCDSKKVIKRGFQSGKQRYRCKECKKVFCETSVGTTYSRNEKRLLSMLLNMLENDFQGKLDLQEVLELSKNTTTELVKSGIVQNQLNKTIRKIKCLR